MSGVQRGQNGDLPALNVADELVDEVLTRYAGVVGPGDVSPDAVPGLSNDLDGCVSGGDGLVLAERPGEELLGL